MRADVKNWAIGELELGKSRGQTGSCQSHNAKQKLGGGGFDDGDAGGCGDDAGEAEPGGGEEGLKLVFGAGAAAGANEHVDVTAYGAAAGFGLIDVRRVDAFDDEEFCVGTHGAAAGLQDGAGLFVRPIVDDVFDGVGVGALGNGFEEISGDGTESIG